MSAPINARKLQHLNIVTSDPETERHGSGFASVQLIHRALPEINFADIDTRVDFLGKTLKLPLIISSMTGGNHPLINTINQNLAIAAEAKQVALATGSQRVMFSDAGAKQSFALRELAPSTVLVANLGAVQLNYGFDEHHCQQAVDILAADGLYLHLNPLQEAIQPEGDTHFANLADKIAHIKNALNVPILLKEVGSGLSCADLDLGVKAGVLHFDIAGRGGTSWSQIEYQRRIADDDDLGKVFADWGMPTRVCLTLLQQHIKRHFAHLPLELIASGGVRNGIDMAKSVILGAHICGVAAPFLQPAMHSAQAVINAINKLENEFKTAMFVLGKQSVGAMRGDGSLILPALGHQI